MKVYVVCDKCYKSKPENVVSEIYNDDGFCAFICFDCQPTLPR